MVEIWNERLVTFVYNAVRDLIQEMTSGLLKEVMRNLMRNKFAV